jgi:hypothetical protein
VLAAGVPVIPLLIWHYPARCHDLQFHISSWMEAEQQFRQGIVFPRWAAGANYGFGEPRFIFYPPLSWVTGAALGAVLPWRNVPAAYVWLIFAVAGVSMWRCASDWMSRWGAIIAGVLYATNPYFVVAAYRRCAYAELLAAAFVPLLVCGTLRIARNGPKALVLLASAFAAIWLSDFPAAVIATYALVCLLITVCVVQRSWQPARWGGAAMVAGFGMAAFVLFPAAWERQWINVSAAILPLFDPERNFLFTHNHASPAWAVFNWKVSVVALVLIGGTALAFALARRLRQDAPDAWWSLGILGAVSTAMMLPVSFIAWRLLPELRYVQFPWRWLSELAAAGAFLGASAIASARRKWMLSLAVVVGVGLMTRAAVPTDRWNSREVEDLALATRGGGGYEGAPEYGPKGSRATDLPRNAPKVTVAREGDESDPPRPTTRLPVARWEADRWMFSVDSPQPSVLKLKLFAYPAWQAAVNGNPVDLQREPTGLVLLPIPAGVSHAEIRFVPTWDQTAGLAASVVTVVVILVIAARGRLPVYPRPRGAP